MAQTDFTLKAFLIVNQIISYHKLPPDQSGGNNCVSVLFSWYPILICPLSKPLFFNYEFITLCPHVLRPLKAVTIKRPNDSSSQAAHGGFRARPIFTFPMLPVHLSLCFTGWHLLWRGWRLSTVHYFALLPLRATGTHATSKVMNIRRKCVHNQVAHNNFVIHTIRWRFGHRPFIRLFWNMPPVFKNVGCYLDVQTFFHQPLFRNGAYMFFKLGLEGCAQS